MCRDDCISLPLQLLAKASPSTGQIQEIEKGTPALDGQSGTITLQRGSVPPGRSGHSTLPTVSPRGRDPTVSKGCSTSPLLFCDSTCSGIPLSHPQKPTVSMVQRVRQMIWNQENLVPRCALISCVYFGQLLNLSELCSVFSWAI